MSPVKIAGHCTACDARCFDVMQVFEEHERNPGEPKQLGAPTADARRVTFVLYDGTQMALTFCGDCEIPPDTYPEVWRKVMRSWQRELSDETPEWFVKQFQNGLLRVAVQVPWKEAFNG